MGLPVVVVYKESSVTLWLEHKVRLEKDVISDSPKSQDFIMTLTKLYSLSFFSPAPTKKREMFLNCSILS